jgi:hypothetical protein
MDRNYREPQITLNKRFLYYLCSHWHSCFAISDFRWFPFKTLYWLKSIANHSDYQNVKFSGNTLMLNSLLPERLCDYTAPYRRRNMDRPDYAACWDKLIITGFGEFATREDALALCGRLRRIWIPADRCWKWFKIRTKKDSRRSG